MQEVWRDVDGSDGFYRVSNFGRVKSFHGKCVRFLKLRTVNSGYVMAMLCLGGKSYFKTVHRLVAKAFIPNPDAKPEVNHIDDNKLNNRADNLEWVTHTENMRHAHATGLMKVGIEKSTVRKLSRKQAQYVCENPDGLSQNRLAKNFGVSRQIISQVQRGATYKSVDGRKFNRGRPCRRKDSGMVSLFEQFGF